MNFGVVGKGRPDIIGAVQPVFLCALLKNHANDSHGTNTGKRKIGSFVELWHDVAGEVFALDDETILIENFVYDGQVGDQKCI